MSNKNETTTKICNSCFGSGQVERGSAGPDTCTICEGNGTIKTIKNVDHYEVMHEI